MTNRYEIVPATFEHATSLAPRIREADRREVWAATRGSPIRSLQLGLMVSRDPKAGMIDDRVECMFGIGDTALLTGKGAPWMLASPVLERHARRFLRLSREYLEEAKKGYDFLENYVDQRNEAAVKWLAWLGFTIHDPEPFGPDKYLFHRFTMRVK